jgi:transposase
MYGSNGRAGRETFVPLAHPSRHAQVDFGEAVGVIGGVRQKIHFFCMDLPQSDACFVKGYAAVSVDAQTIGSKKQS